MCCFSSNSYELFHENSKNWPPGKIDGKVSRRQQELDRFSSNLVLKK
jgi:hypothetical protein